MTPLPCFWIKCTPPERDLLKQRLGVDLHAALPIGCCPFNFGIKGRDGLRLASSRSSTRMSITSMQRPFVAPHSARDQPYIGRCFITGPLVGCGSMLSIWVFGSSTCHTCHLTRAVMRTKFNIYFSNTCPTWRFMMLITTYCRALCSACFACSVPTGVSVCGAPGSQGPSSNGRVMASG